MTYEYTINQSKVMVGPVPEEHVCDVLVSPWILQTVSQRLGQVKRLCRILKPMTPASASKINLKEG